MQCSFLYLILKEEIKSVGGNGKIQIKSAVYLGITYFPWFLSMFILFFCFWGLYLWHMEVPRLEVKLELQLPAYTTATATATWDPSHIFDLHHSSWQCQIVNRLSEPRDRNCVLMDASQIRFRWATMGTLILVGFLIYWATTGSPLLTYWIHSWMCFRTHWKVFVWMYWLYLYMTIFMVVLRILNHPMRTPSVKHSIPWNNLGEFLLWHITDKSDWYLWGWGFNPWPRSVG